MPAYGKYMPESFCKQLIFPDIPAYYLCILSKPEYKISKLLATLKIAFHITDGLNILKIFSRNLYLKLFLQCHYHLKKIKGICSEIFFERCFCCHCTYVCS